MIVTSNVTVGGTGPGETVLPAPGKHEADSLAAAYSAPDPLRAVQRFVAEHPRSLEGWSALGTLLDEPILSYMAYRVGYHRGLDALRASGWRGSGFVRGSHTSNRGFLDCLRGLARLAEEIGEHDEAERCRIFALQLDPTGS